jgi:hypothetical protein
MNLLGREGERLQVRWKVWDTVIVIVNIKKWQAFFGRPEGGRVDEALQLLVLGVVHR